ncbi:MAG: DUF2442 domain-containing protein [bacterium]
MLFDIISAEYLDEYRIKVTFENKKTGIVDFNKYLKRGGVFEKFKNIEFFKSFQLDKEIGNLTWNKEIDIAPEILYSEAIHSPLPKWMEN